MGFLSSDKPYTAVTSTIESLCGRDYEEDDVADMVELMEIIHLRPDGPTEAARAIRKKLKYGGKHAQLRALVILDTLVENGERLSMLFNDTQLMDRLKIVVSGQEGLHPMDSAVQKKAQAYAKSWSRYKGKRGYEGISSLYRGGATSSSAARSRASSNAGGRRASRYSSRVEDLSEDSDDSRDGYDSPPRSRDSPRARDSPRTPRDRSPHSDEDRKRGSRNSRYERGFDDEPRGSKPFFSSKTRTRGSTPADDDYDEEPESSERPQFSSRNRRSGGGVAEFEDREKPEKSKRSSLSKFFKGSPEPPTSPRGTPSGLSASSSSAPMNAKIEKPRIQEILAESHAAATNLNNALRMVNKDKGQLSTQDAYATECFNKCRKLRKKVVRYIHGIHDDEFVGPLLHANEELIAALRHYDKLASIHGSDSEPEDDWREDDGLEDIRAQVANISIPKRAPPPIPKKPKDLHYSDEDDDNPFGDDNEL
ncbi:Protein lsb5 [Yarrowia sp. B02]|nr:Protein lsb5 [Yarrowia sp. B02]